MTKLYVGRYANKELANPEVVKVAISRGMPKFKLGYTISGTIIQLAPPGYIFGINDKFLFRKRYFEHLDKIGVDKVRELLEGVGYGKAKEIVLLCYEDITTDKWCHRTLFAEWWELRTGEKVEEYPDKTTFAEKEKKKEKELDGQLDMFGFGI